MPSCGRDLLSRTVSSALIDLLGVFLLGRWIFGGANDFFFSGLTAVARGSGVHGSGL
jgi:hypothetical protein